MQLDIESNATIGGNTKETLVFSGLQENDVILNTHLTTMGANPTKIASVFTAAAKPELAVNEMLCEFESDPGAGAKVTATVERG